MSVPLTTALDAPLSGAGTRSAAVAVPSAPGRMAFVDIARAGAILMMIQGHTLNAVLADHLRSGSLFDTWVFFRGFTACFFLTLSGFVLALSMHRDRIARGLRRCAQLMVVGYLLHFPVSRIRDLAYLSDERWQGFLTVDVLQCLAVTLALLYIAAIWCRTQWQLFLAASFGFAAAVTLAATASIAPGGGLPYGIAAFLTPAGGSQFPLLPWSAYVFLGAALGALHGHRRLHDEHAFSVRTFLAIGGAMLTMAIGASLLWQGSAWQTAMWSSPILLVLWRGGAVLVVLAAIAHLSRRARHLPVAIHVLARESLVVYVAHLCVIYGSAWNPGVRQYYGTSLPLASALILAVLIAAAMIALAGAWHWCKRHHARTARVARLAAAGLLLASLA